MQTFHVKRLPEKVGIMAGEPEEDLKEFQLFELFTKWKKKKNTKQKKRVNHHNSDERCNDTKNSWHNIITTYCPWCDTYYGI